MAIIRALSEQLRYSIRGLRKSPGFTISALAILTLGIGANTAIFSVVNAVLLKPLPFPESESIVMIFHVPPARSFPGVSIFPVSPANYLDWRNETNAFESMSAIGGRNLRLGGGSRPQSVSAAMTEPDFFHVVRVQPVIGRVFTAEECQPGRDAVIVLSYGFAENHFGSANAAVGQNLDLDGRIRKVIGVMPAGFRNLSWFPTAVQAWIPVAWTAEQRATRGNHNFRVVARLRPGVTLNQAQARINVLSERLARDYPEENTGWGAVVLPLRDFLVGDVRLVLLTLMGAVGFVLLIACANTANLVLARTIARGKELAIRTALGASTGQAIRPVLFETTLLAVAGGALGTLFAQSGQALVIAALADRMPRSAEIRLDLVVLGFTFIASVLTGVAAGMIACWRVIRIDPNESLKQGLGKTDAQSGGNRTRSALVVCEVALSLMLLVGAGLMIRSLFALRSVDPGFQSTNVVTMTVPIPESARDTQRNRLYDEFLPQVRSLAGVLSVGGVDSLPLSGGGSKQPIVVEGRPAEVFALQPNVDVRRVTPGYIQAMRIPLVIGRDFMEEDTLGRKAVVLISESMARQFWPGENPIGKRLRISFTPEIAREVVGVVADVKDRGLGVLEPEPILYQPVLQKDSGNLSLVVRCNSNPLELVSSITQELHRLNPELPVRNVQTMEDVVALSLSQQRFSMFLFAVLAGLAFLLAAVGVYSVLAYSVRRRVHEIGIRMALGARASDVLQLVVIEGMKPTLIGVAIGIFGAYTLSGILSRLIYGVSTTDPWTFGTVILMLAIVALIACVIPAYRATRVEPVTVLRNE
jgi:putative ABC transport system permease protein